MNKTHILLGLVVIAIVAGALFAIATGSPQPKGTTKVEPRATPPEMHIDTSTNSTDDNATSTTKTSVTEVKPIVVSTEKTYTLADVALHNTPESCWSAVNGAVYDLTGAIDKHPGGPEAIKKICGTDGSALFTKQHDGQEKPNMFLASLKIGVLVQ